MQKGKSEITCPYKGNIFYEPPTKKANHEYIYYLIWMCHSRKIHRQINKIHERALRIVYTGNASPFNELLEKSGSVSIHKGHPYSTYAAF